MRIGLHSHLATTLENGAADIAAAEAAGLASVWKSAGGLDSMVQLAFAAPRTSRIELGTAILSIWQRHPVSLAQQALTVQAASGGRFVLGLGLSYRALIEGQQGFDWKPLRRMREFLTVLAPLMAGDEVTFSGEAFRFRGYRQPPLGDVSPPPVVIAAHGPGMQELAGRLADGMIVTFAGPRYFRDVAVPTVTKAAREAGRPSPRIVASVPVWVTDRDSAEVREAVAPEFAKYDQRTSYRAVLDVDGAARAVDALIIGTEAEVRSRLEDYAAAGVTDLVGEIMAEREDEAARSRELLGALALAS